MLEFLKNLNQEKGAASMVEMILVGTVATVVIGGLTGNAQDVLDEASDTQRVANLRQLATALELYYSDNQSYPQTDFDGLISELVERNYLGSLPTAPENYGYQDLNNGESYVLKVLLEDPESHYLEIDLDGNIGELNCQDPYYCLRM